MEIFLGDKYLNVQENAPSTIGLYARIDAKTVLCEKRCGAASKICITQENLHMQFYTKNALRIFRGTYSVARGSDTQSGWHPFFVGKS